MVRIVQLAINQACANIKIKENKIMGLTAKPVLKMQSIMRKMENQLEAERKAAKEKKEAKKNKKS